LCVGLRNKKKKVQTSSDQKDVAAAHLAMENMGYDLVVGLQANFSLIIGLVYVCMYVCINILFWKTSSTTNHFDC
jgi:hypothetical protein